jgi:hypothetical protein
VLLQNVKKSESGNPFVITQYMFTTVSYLFHLFSNYFPKNLLVEGLTFFISRFRNVSSFFTKQLWPIRTRSSLPSPKLENSNADVAETQEICKHKCSSYTLLKINSTQIHSASAHGAIKINLMVQTELYFILSFRSCQMFRIVTTKV